MLISNKCSLKLIDIDIFRLPWINKIVVAVSMKYNDYMQTLIDEYNLHKVSLASGASTRHRSIYNGLKHLAKGNNHTSTRHRSIYNGLKHLAKGNNHT